MKKKDLCAKAGISSAFITQMRKKGHVITEILLKICTALDCSSEDILGVPMNTVCSSLSNRKASWLANLSRHPVWCARWWKFCGPIMDVCMKLRLII